MGYKVLTLSPGSTSTKVAVFDADAAGVDVLMNSNVRHDPTDLVRFFEAADQLDYRIETILDELKLNDIDLSEIDAFSGYCGGMGPTEGGIFVIDQTVCDHVLNCGMNHPAILGAPILHSFATQYNKPAFAVNQPDTDELADVARITGFPGVYRKSHVHCLNQKEVAIRYATQINKAYEEGNFIVAHIGGGLSVAAHDHGKMVDANDVLEGSGPFAPNRSGDVPLRPVVKMCYEGADQKDVLGVIGRTGGLKGLVGDGGLDEGQPRRLLGHVPRPVHSPVEHQVAAGGVYVHGGVVHSELHRPVRLAGEQERVAGGAVVEQAALAVDPGGDDLETDAGKAGKLRLSVRQRHRIPPPGPQLRRQIQQRFVEISHEPFPVQGHGIVVRGPVQLAQGHFHQLQRSHRHLTPASGRRPR
jgi:butyrate kinase